MPNPIPIIEPEIINTGQINNLGNPVFLKIIPSGQGMSGNTEYQPITFAEFNARKIWLENELTKVNVDILKINQN